MGDKHDPVWEHYQEKRRAMKELLATSFSIYRPRWWQIHRLIGLRARRRWALVALYYDWPHWGAAAVRCGVPQDLIAAQAKLLDVYVRFDNRDDWDPED